MLHRPSDNEKLPAAQPDLTFEYCSDIDAEITTPVVSIKNPISGTIRVDHVAQIILDPDKIDPKQTQIIPNTQNEATA